MTKTKLEIIKNTPYLFNCEVAEKDFCYLLNKLNKLHLDLTQMKKLGNLETVDIDYLLEAIDSDSY